MASLDTVSIGILFGAVLVLAGILSSLVALRFGAPLLLVFLIVGMLAGQEGPGGIKFDAVGSVEIALAVSHGYATCRRVVVEDMERVQSGRVDVHDDA